MQKALTLDILHSILLGYPSAPLNSLIMWFDKKTTHLAQDAAKAHQQKALKSLALSRELQAIRGRKDVFYVDTEWVHDTLVEHSRPTTALDPICLGKEIQQLLPYEELTSNHSIPDTQGMG